MSKNLASASASGASVTRTQLKQNRIVFKPPSNIPRVEADDPRLSFENATHLVESYKPLFRTQLHLKAISLPGRQLPLLNRDPTIAKYFFSAFGVRHVQPFPGANGDDSKRILILNLAADEQELPREVQQVVDTHEFEVIDHTVEMGWQNLTSDQILEAILPSDLVMKEGVPTGFTIVGHIAHLNLLEVYLPYRFLVGQIILDKNSGTLRTVVNKLDTIDTKFRFFKMELLAGTPDYTPTVSESDCTFKFDFRKVYWNSRLHGEHARLINLCRPNQVLADVMAGVGPFAVPAAKRNHTWVLANDLNPHSYKSLVQNAHLNKVLLQNCGPTQSKLSQQGDEDAQQEEQEFSTNLKPNCATFDGGVLAYCMDGREFILHAMKQAWNSPFRGRPKLPSSPSSSSSSTQNQSTEHRAKIADEQVIQYGKNHLKQKQKLVRKPQSKASYTNAHQSPPASQQQQGGKSQASHPTSSSSSAGTVQNKLANLDVNAVEVDRFESRKLIDHFIMNLPATAIEFLDAFQGAYTRLSETITGGKEALVSEIDRCQHAMQHKNNVTNNDESVDDSMLPYPMIHVHCFSKDPFTPAQDILTRVNQALGIPEDAEHKLTADPIPLPPQTNHFFNTLKSHKHQDESHLAKAAGSQSENEEKSDHTTTTDAYFSNHPLYPTIMERGIRSPEALLSFLTEPTTSTAKKVTQGLSIHYVRDVAPNKQMYCVSFPVPPQVLWS